MPPVSRLRTWILASRPVTLTAAVIPVLAGAALARVELHENRWTLFWLALAGAILIQIGTNFVNDAKDFERGTDTGERLGPLRVTQAGLLTAPSVMRGAWIAFALAMLCGIPLVIAGGLPIVAIGITSIIAAYAYTGGPYPLGYHGFGELFVILFFGVIAVGGTYYLQTDSIGTHAVAGGLAIGCLSSVLLAVNNLRDESGDRISGKKTLVVRFGHTFGLLEIAVLALLPFLMATYWWANELRMTALLPLFALPLALLVVWRSSNETGAGLNRVLKLAAALHAGYGILLSAGLLMDAA